MSNFLIPTEFRYLVISEARILLKTMTLETAINCASTRIKNYRESGAIINFQFYTEVHECLESLALNN